MDVDPSRISVIVPALNEAEVIEGVLQPLKSAGFTIVLVDDGSTDNTFDLVNSLGIDVIRHSINLGQGAALQTGFEYFKRNPQLGDYLVTYDADGQHLPGNVISLVERLVLENVDVALGSRFIEGKFGGGRLKYVILRVSAKLARYSIGLRVTDRHNGLRAFKRSAAVRISLKQPGFGHADEILRQIKSLGLTYVEVPVEIIYTPYSRKKGQPLVNGINILFDKFLGQR